MATSYPPELALFEAPIRDATIQKIQYVEYRPTSQLNSGPLQFYIPSTANQYIDLRRSKLCLKVKIVKGDGSAPTAAEHVAPANLTMHSLFSQVDIQLQQQTVSSSAAQSYPYKAYLQTVLQYGREAKETFLEMQGYYKDRAGFMETMEPDPRGNTGWADRFIHFVKGAVVDLEGPLLSDIWQQNKAILNGVELQLKLWPAKPDFILCTKADGADYKMELVEACLRICKLTPIPEVMLAHAETIRDNPALYNFDRSEIKTFQLNKGQYSFHLEDLFQMDVPSRLVVGMVTATSFNGTYDSNPFDFRHFDLRSLAVYLDDESVPGRPIKTNFKALSFLEGYNSLFSSDDEDGTFISREDYPAGYTLYMFRLAPDHAPHHIPFTSRGNVRLSGNFGTALAENVTLIVYAQFPALMTVDSSRNIKI